MQNLKSQKDVTGLILAGGRSRRFGADKARHPVAGRPMIAHVCAALRAVTDRVLVSVRDEEMRFDVPAPHVADRYPGCGPLAGLHAGLQAAETPWVLAVACDLPFVTPDVLQALVSARDPQASAVVTRTPDGRWQPLCACYPAGILSLVEQQLAAGGLSMHELLRLLPHLRLVDIPGAPLRNVNTPSDLPG